MRIPTYLTCDEKDGSIWKFVTTPCNLQAATTSAIDGDQHANGIQQT
jgi:hypothetical protein